MTIREILKAGYDIDSPIIVYIDGNEEYFDLVLNKEESGMCEIVVDVGEIH